jgi:predicted acyl esterase
MPTSHHHRTRSATVPVVVLLLALLLQGSVGARAATADESPDAGRAFLPTPVSQPLYGTSAAIPSDVEGPGGDTIAVDVYLPVARGGHVPPARVPVVLLMTGYALLDLTEQTGGIVDHHDTRDLLTARGYAVAIGSTPGTGRSDGCVDYGSPREVEATTRVIEHLAAQPWSTGAVGMYGLSYDAITQLGVVTSGDPARLRALKAIVPVAGFASEYEVINFDGVPQLYLNTFNSAVSLALPGADPACRASVTAGRARTDVDGDFSAFYAERDGRALASRVRAATLLVHSFRDGAIPIDASTSWTRHLPTSTPFKVLLGQWQHAYPHEPGPPYTDQVRHRTIRRDFHDMVVAWFDRYLKGLDSGVEGWPAVQVQDSDLRWRAEASWPHIGRRAGHLPLAVDGPATYEEVDGSATLTTPALSRDLHLVGQPVLDLWVRLEQPDAHVAVEVYAGDRLITFGARSAQHLDAMPSGYFTQSTPRPAAVGSPVHVPVRLRALDEVVPAGTPLRIVVSGQMVGFTSPSGSTGTVEVLTGCPHTPLLRFRTADPAAPSLNVWDVEAARADVVDRPAPRSPADGGAVPLLPVCGRGPIDPLAALS